MPTFTVKAGADLQFTMPCRYLLINSITSGLSAILRSRESDLDVDLVVRGGGKLSGFPEPIALWTLINENGIDIEVDINSGNIFYDENRLDGDVNSLSRFANLTPDGNQFFGGFEMNSFPGNFSFEGFYNPVASGITTNIQLLRLSAYGATFKYYKIDSVLYGTTAWLFNATCTNKDIFGAESKTRLLAGIDPAVVGTNLKVSLPSDLNGTPVPLDMKNAPIQLNEGEGLLFIPTVLNNTVLSYAEFFEN